MERCARPGSRLVTIILLVALTGSVGAHDFWLEPSSFQVRVGDPVRIHLRVGERFVGDPVVRHDARIERFVVAGPAAERPVLGREGMDPAGLLRLDAPGIWYVGYQSRPASVQLAPTAFELYLREEGLERIIEERAARQESGEPGREHFSRSVKALLRGAPAEHATGFDRILGLPLEFKLDADPVAAPGGRLGLRLLHHGQPLEGSLVVALRKNPRARGEGVQAFRGRTDTAGRVVVPVGEGQWLVKAVQMQRAAPGSGADWISVWTSLTFEVQATPR